MKAWGLFFLYVPALYSAQSYEFLLDRYEAMLYSSQIEDVWAHQKRLASNSYISLNSQNKNLADNLFLRREWYLRLGSSSVPLVLNDLNDLDDPKLFDEILWSLLMEGLNNNVWLPYHDWEAIRSTINSYLSTHPLGKTLDQESKSSWWRWFQNKKVADNADPELRALDNVLRARQEINPLKKVELFFVAFKELSNNVAAQRELAFELWSHSGNTQEQRRMVFREFHNQNIKSQLSEYGFEVMANALFFRSLNRESSEFRSYVLINKLERGVRLPPSEIKKIADQQFFETAYAKAHSYYSLIKLSEAQNFDEFEFLEFNAKSLLSAFYAGEFKDTAIASAQDAFENVIDKAFHSIYRDMLLSAYADFLEKVKDTEAAIELSAWTFQFSLDPERRLDGYKRFSRNMRTLLSGREPGLSSKTNVLRWISVMSTWKKHSGGDPAWTKERLQLQSIVERLGLGREADVQASLGELRD